MSPPAPGMVRMAATLVFLGATSANGNQLFELDGSGSTAVDLAGYPADGGPVTDITPFAGGLYFSGGDATGTGLWVLHGASAPAASLTAGLSSDLDPKNLTVVGSTLFFSGLDPAGNADLYVSNGTSSGTMPIAPAGAAASGLAPNWFASLDGRLYFSGRDSSGNADLWVSDATAAGTSALAVANTDTRNIGGFGPGLDPTNLAVANGKLFFSGYDAAGANTLWVSDGTAAGTTEILAAGSATGGLAPTTSNIVAFGGKAYFAGTDSAGNVDLWSSDGTAAGTVALAIAGAGNTGITPVSLTVFDGALYFGGTASDGTTGLWRSDGTAAGTTGVRPEQRVDHGFAPHRPDHQRQRHHDLRQLRADHRRHADLPEPGRRPERRACPGLTASTGNILFDQTLGSTAANSTDLTVTTSAAGSSVTFTGAVGGGVASPSATALNSLTVNSPTIHIDGGVVNTASTNPRGLPGVDGTQTYNGVVLLGMSTTLVGASVTNTGVINAQGNDLTLTLSGLTSVPLAGIVNVHDFTSNGTGGTNITGDFQTTGFQHYDNFVTLSGPATLTAGVVAGQDSIFFGSTINSAGHFALTLNTSGPITFAGTVGATDALGSLATLGTGMTFLDGSIVRTVGSQTYAGPVVLGPTGDQTTLTSTDGGAIQFSSTVDGNVAGVQALTTSTTGNQTFSGLVGSTAPLSGLTTGTGATIFDMAVGTALAGVRVQGNVMTGGAVTFDEAGSSLTHPSVLTLGNGAQTYGGTVTLLGAVTVLNSASTEPATGTFHGGGTITFDGNIVSGIPVDPANGTPELDVRAGAGTVEFDAPINTTGDFAPGGASVIFKGSVGPVGIFTVLPNDTTPGIGAIDINGGSVTTGGSQFYNLGTVISANTILQAGGNITFAATLNGSNLATNTPYTLDIKISGGVIAFDGIVGGVVPLESLTIENVGAKVGTTQFNMVLPLASTGQGGVNVINAVNIGTNTDFEAVGLPGGTVPTILSGVTYLGQVGTGTQTYGGAVTLGLSSLLQQTTVLRDIPAAGSITFNGRINGKMDGDAGLSVDAGGDEIFNQLVGDAHPLASLSTDDVSGGTGATRFNMDLTQTGTLAGVRVAGTVNVNDRVVFNATGGLVHPTVLSGGAQNYALDATIRQGTVLTVDPTSRTTGLPADSGNIVFLGNVDSGTTAQALQVNSPGNEIFGGLVGSASPLASLTTDATGPGTGQTQFVMTLPSTGLAAGVGGVNTTGAVTINDAVYFRVGNTADLPADHPSVVSGGTQTYNGAATLADSTILTSTGGSIVFNEALDSDATATPRDLITNTPAAGSLTTFAKAVGGTFPLASLRTNGLGTTQIDGGAVTTVGSQSYFEPVTLGQDTVVRTFAAGGNIEFNSALDGTFNLEVDADTASFSAVGNNAPLLNLTVNARTGAQFNYTSALVTAGNAGVNLAGALTVNGPVFFNAANAGNVVFVRTGVAVAGQNLVSSQDYANAFTLAGSASFLDLKSGNITFHQGVDASSPLGLSGLTVGTGGTVSFLGAVGAVNPLTSLTTSNLGLATGRTIISGGSVTTANNGVAGATGQQTYNDAVVLGADAVLTSTATGGAAAGGDIAFNSTVDSNATTPQALTVDTAGRTIFGGAVGVANALASVTTDDEGAQDQGTFIDGGSVKTTGAQTYNDGVQIGAATTLASTAGGDIVFNSTLDSNTTGTPQALTVDTAGRTIFGGAVGVANALASVTTDDEGAQDQGTFIDGGSVKTTGAQTYNDGVQIGAATTLASTAGGDIVFNSTLDSNTTGTPQALTVDTAGRTIFGGAVGVANALASVTTDDEGAQDQGTFINGGSVKTTGAQTYNDGVQIGAATTLASSADGTLIFNGTVNGAYTLTLNTGGLTIFNRAVGGATPLKALTTDNEGAPGEETQFNMTVGANAAGVVVNGPVTINDAVLFNVQGSSLSRPGILTLGNGFSQTYNGLATLGTSTFLVSASALPVGGAPFTGGGSVVFNSPLGIVAKGGSNLSVRAGVGVDTLTAAVNVGALDLGGASATFHGPITLPGTLSVEPNDATGGGSIAFTGSTLTTTGAQTYNAAFVLGGNTTLTSTGGGTLTFTSTVDGPFALTLNSAGNEVFDGRVGGTTPLASVTTDDPAAVITGGHVVFNIAGSATAAPSVTTTGTQTYNDAATLRADTVLASTGGGTLTFASTVDSDAAATPRTLTLNSAGDEVFDGQVGGLAALASLTTDDPAANSTGGRTIFNVPGGTPSVTTVAFQTYNDAVVLQAGTTLTSLGGGALTFVSTLDGPGSLTLATAGQTTFQGAVGGGTALASLTTQGGGGIAINGRAVTTKGLQTYGGVTTLGADTVLTSTAANGGVTFATTLDSDATATPRALTINAAGDETFNGRVGSAAPLASLTTDDPAAGISGGRVIFNIGGSSAASPSVTTIGAQTYHDAALLQTGTVLASTNGGTLTFNSTVDGPFALTLDTAGNEVFGGTVGGVQALASLTTDANASSSGGQVIFGLPGASGALGVTTTGAQTYNDAALLQTATTLVSTNGGTLTFAATVDGPFALTLNSKGDEVFDGQIGHQSALASLTTDADASNAGGSMRFFFDGTNASPSVTTTGTQAYHDAAVLQADTVLASTRGGRLAFLSTVDNSNVTNPHALTLNTAGDELFGGLVGAAKAIGNLTIDASGPTGGQTQFAMDLTGQKGNTAGVTVHGTVTINDAVSFNAAGASARNVLVQSTGAQTYNGPASVTSDAFLASSGSGALTFNSTVVGPGALTVNTGGRTTFNGAVGSGAGNALASLTTQGGPVTLNAGSVTTTGAQSYAGAVMLGQDTRLTSSTDGVNFGTTLDGQHALTLATANATVFNGAVGGSVPLTNVTATDGTGVVVNGGRVATLGLQTYGGEVSVNGPADGTTILLASNDETSADLTQHGNIDFRQNVTVNSGSLLVQGRRILAETSSNIAVAGAGNLDLEASDVLILRGTSYGSDSGSVILNDPRTGATPLAVNSATIFLTNQRTTFHGGSFDMGYLQNMFSQGSISINVGGGTATLSDIAANGTLNVSAGAIILRARNPDAARGGAGGGTDDGLNFVARTSINFGSSPIRYDNTYSANDVANFVSSDGQITVNRDQAVGLSIFQDPTLAVLFAQTNNGIKFNDAVFGSFSGFPLQPISGGTQTIDTAAALSGALPDQKPLDVAVDITVTAGQLEELKKLGIHPRRAARQERVSLNAKRALFAQLVDGQDQDNYGLLQPIKGGISRLVPSDYVVVVDRMSEREVQSILTAFEQLYGKDKEKAAPIGEAFNAAFTDYTTEKQTGDAAGFAPYLLEKQGKYPDVDKAILGFDNLFGYIEHLGLTDREQAKSKEHIASDLQVSGVSPEDMVKVIDTLRAKIPKDQKASSTKLPPSPPATAPAPGATNPPPTQKATPPLKTARQPGNDPTRKTVRQAKPKEDRLHEVAGL